MAQTAGSGTQSSGASGTSSQGYLLSQNLWLAELYPTQAASVAALLQTAPSGPEIQQQLNQAKTARQNADFGDMKVTASTLGNEQAMNQNQSRLGQLNAYQNMLNLTMQYGPQLAAYLKAGNYTQAWAYAVAHSNGGIGLVQFLETSTGLGLMGLTSMSTAQMSAFYDAAWPYWNGNILGTNPYSPTLWGDPNKTAYDVQVNSTTQGDSSLPDLARFAGKQPSESFFDKFGAPILEAVAAIVIGVCTAGAGAAVGAALFGSETAASTVVGSVVVGAAEGAAESAAEGGNIALGALGGAVGAGVSSGLSVSGATANINSGLSNVVGTTAAPYLTNVAVGTAVGTALDGGHPLTALTGAIEGAGEGAASGAITDSINNQAAINTAAQQDVTDSINQTNTKTQNAYSAGITSPGLTSPVDTTSPVDLNAPIGNGSSGVASGSGALTAVGDINTDGALQNQNLVSDLQPISITTQRLPASEGSGNQTTLQGINNIITTLSNSSSIGNYLSQNPITANNLSSEHDSLGVGAEFIPSTNSIGIGPGFLQMASSADPVLQDIANAALTHEFTHGLANGESTDMVNFSLTNPVGQESGSPGSIYSLSPGAVFSTANAGASTPTANGSETFAYAAEVLSLLGSAQSATGAQQSTLLNEALQTIQTYYSPFYNATNQYNPDTGARSVLSPSEGALLSSLTGDTVQPVTDQAVIQAANYGNVFTGLNSGTQYEVSSNGLTITGANNTSIEIEEKSNGIAVIFSDGQNAPATVKIPGQTGPLYAYDIAADCAECLQNYMAAALPTITTAISNIDANNAKLPTPTSLIEIALAVSTDTPTTPISQNLIMSVIDNGSGVANPFTLPRQQPAPVEPSAASVVDSSAIDAGVAATNAATTVFAATIPVANPEGLSLGDAAANSEAATSAAIAKVSLQASNLSSSNSADESRETVNQRLPARFGSGCEGRCL